MPSAKTQAAWKLGQIAAIVALTWVMLGGADPRPDPKLSTPLAFVVTPIFATILVAFGTAILVNLWDWIARLLGRPNSKLQGTPVRPVPTLRPADREARHTVEQRDGGSAWLRRCQLGKPPAASLKS